MSIRAIESTEIEKQLASFPAKRDEKKTKLPPLIYHLENVSLSYRNVLLKKLKLKFVPSRCCVNRKLL